MESALSTPLFEQVAILGSYTRHKHIPGPIDRVISGFSLRLLSLTKSEMIMHA